MQQQGRRRLGQLPALQGCRPVCLAEWLPNTAGRHTGPPTANILAVLAPPCTTCRHSPLCRLVEDAECLRAQKGPARPFATWQLVLLGAAGGAALGAGLCAAYLRFVVARHMQAVRAVHAVGEGRLARRGLYLASAGPWHQCLPGLPGAACPGLLVQGPEVEAEAITLLDEEGGEGQEGQGEERPPAPPPLLDVESCEAAVHEVRCCQHNCK